MSTIDEIKNSLPSEITPSKNQADELISDEDILIFLSFDLVGSTKLKTECHKDSNWQNVILSFYDLIENEVRERLPTAVVWKYIGDEILFQLSVRRLSNINNIPSISWEIQTAVSDKLYNKAEGTVAVKTTLWIAGIKKIPDTLTDETEDLCKPFRNACIKKPVAGFFIPDFIGPDIDIGFRVSKFANKHAVTLSADFAYVLSHCYTDTCNSLKLVSLNQLKGVWKSDFYPVVWYHPHWECISEKFHYSECKQNEIIENIVLHKEQDIGCLDKIYKDRNRTSDATNFLNKFKELRKK